MHITLLLWDFPHSEPYQFHTPLLGFSPLEGPTLLYEFFPFRVLSSQLRWWVTPNSEDTWIQLRCWDFPHSEAKFASTPDGTTPFRNNTTNLPNNSHAKLNTSELKGQHFEEGAITPIPNANGNTSHVRSKEASIPKEVYVYLFHVIPFWRHPFKCTLDYV